MHNYLEQTNHNILWGCDYKLYKNKISDMQISYTWQQSGTAICLFQFTKLPATATNSNK